MKQFTTKIKKDLNKGTIIIQAIVFGAIAIYLMSALVGWVATNLKASRQTLNKEQALQIAEAGIDYYRWHLAHSSQDYKDGTGNPGPYIHNFKDKDGNIIGQFSLLITPPPLGSSLVTVRSAGTLNADPLIHRTIEVRMAKPSFAKYAVAANGVMRFGEGTETYGPIHSNGGIRYDGIAHNIVTSAVSSYNDPDHTGNNEFGVHTHDAPTDPLPPNAVPSRTDVFQAGRQFPVPAIDFVGITADLAQMKIDAQAAGFYRAGSGGQGYHIVFNTNDTFALYKVTSLINPSHDCDNEAGQDGWGSWSINNQTVVSGSPFALPPNGIIFLEDNVFVNGQINTARVTVAAASLPDDLATRKSITINNDLLYSNYDGSDVIGLIAQKNINVGMVSEDNLEIDAALIAQNGRVGRYYYNNHCTSYIRDTITLWGMIGTNQRYGFGYADDTGYENRNINYDASLLYAPPPSFPLASEEYITLSWEEIE